MKAESKWPLMSGHFFVLATLLGLLLSACSTLAPAPRDGPAPPSEDIDGVLARMSQVDFLLLGEQHDAPEHHRIERATVESLASQGRLAALALEMVEQGQDTRGLPRDAEQSQVRDSLNWNDRAWPWTAYGPVVMAAVQAGIPVLGANLPRARMKDAMADVSLDVQLEPQALQAQQQAVRDGHCGLLPDSQIQPMTRIQIARDRAMARTLIEARVPGKTVVLVAGAGHVPRGIGVPQHLPTDMKVQVLRLAAGDAPQVSPPAIYDATWTTPALPERDYCAELRKPAR
ncbi:ChaN family lipoprotein [Variovorax dokdonensis]|uniref:ChaN family lipoprotein n=1 Tax=Variovorax dokdonensis TaxID=344883 RepID=A0ABT7NGD0_9BURK|nr:ChaN family lipoprotein [Variovorax dokdonensis]MDM0046973.1 ChaN family lipoprotein [Variovorax dokdonensis]